MNLGKVIREFDVVPRLLPAGDDCPQHGAEVVGWRVWRVGRNLEVSGDPPWSLKSISVSYDWQWPSVRDSAPPEKGSKWRPSLTGFHVFKCRPRAAALAVEMGRRGWEPVALGKCALLGRVIEHEHGYRAQCAVLRSLTVDPARGFETSIGRDLTERYQCEVDFQRHRLAEHERPALESTETSSNRLWGLHLGGGAVGTVEPKGDAELSVAERLRRIVDPFGHLYDQPGAGG